MSWVSIDKEKCNSCGICAMRCIRCFTNESGDIKTHADQETCNLCGHCISLCLTDAITHEKMDMDNFDVIEKPVRYDLDEFISFVRQRRSHRSFKNKPVPREDLAKLAEMCRYIPTGSNFQSVEINIITNTETIKTLSDITVDYFIDMVKGVEDNVEEYVSKGEKIPDDLAQLREFAARYSRFGLAREMGIDPIFHKAPALMVFHSPPPPSTPREDCIIAAQTVTLAAEAMGLGSCYIGLVKAAADTLPAAQKAMGLPAGNKSYCVLILGYPKLKFRRSVDRTPMKVRWDE